MLGGALGGCLVLVAIAAIVLVSTTLSAARGCSGALEETERGVLAAPNAFLEALDQGDYAQAHALLSPDFKDAHPAATFAAYAQAQRGLLGAGPVRIISIRARGKFAALTVDLPTRAASTRATFLLSPPQDRAHTRTIEALNLDPQHTRAAITALTQAHLQHINAADTESARALMTPRLGGSEAGRAMVEALTGPAGAWLRETRASLEELEVDPRDADLARARATALGPDTTPRGELTYTLRRSAHGVWLIDAFGTSSRMAPSAPSPN